MVRLLRSSVQGARTGFGLLAVGGTLVLSGGFAPEDPEPSPVAVLVAVSPSDPAPGDALEVEVTAANQGTAWALGLVVDVELPADRLEDLEADASRGTYDADSGRWDLGWLLPGEVSRLTLSATVAPVGSDP